MPLLSCFRLGLIRASSKRPNQKYTITFLTEGHHPRQGDKQKQTVLPCMWQSYKAYPLAYCPPGRGFVVEL